MAKPRHKGDTKTFEQLTYEEQAKSINATIVQLQQAIFFHIENAKTKKSHARKKCLLQVNRLLGRLVDRTL